MTALFFADIESMRFYHGTSSERWEKIQREGVLWGYRIYDGKPTWDYRYTYLTPHVEVAEEYGEVLLEVEYDPVGVDGRGIDNYGFDPPPGQTCWQFSVFIPIPLSQVKQIAKRKVES